MAKTVSRYEAIPGYFFEASDIAARADVGTGTVSVTNVNFTNILMSQIRNATGIPSNALSQLATGASLNKYVQFCPKTIQKNSLTKDLIVATTNAPYLMGDFAGFNGSAPAPYLEGNYSDGQYIILSGCCTHQTLSYTFKIHLGEFEYLPYLDDGNGNIADTIVVELYDVNGLAVLDELWIPIAGEFTKTNSQDLISYQHTLSTSLSGVSTYKEISVNMYFAYRVDVSTINRCLNITDASITLYAKEDYQTPLTSQADLVYPWADDTTCTLYYNATISHGTITLNCDGSFTIPNIIVTKDGTTRSAALCDIDVSLDGGSTWEIGAGQVALSTTSAVNGTGTIIGALNCSTYVKFRLVKITCR